MYHYQSEATQFLNRLIEEKPELEQQRLENRGAFVGCRTQSRRTGKLRGGKSSEKTLYLLPRLNPPK